MLALMMLVGALTAGVPNATAAHGTETVSLSSVTNSSAMVDVANLDVNDTYYWWVYIYKPDGSSYAASGFRSITNTINGQFNFTWIKPTVNGNYTVHTRITGSLFQEFDNYTTYFVMTNATEIISSNVSSSGCTLTLSRLDTTTNYSWVVMVYDSANNLHDYDSALFTPSSANMTYSASWTAPTTAGNYSVVSSLLNANNNNSLITSHTNYFTIGGGSGTAFNETIALSNITNSSASVDLANLNGSNSYYWYVWIYNSNNTLQTFDYGTVSNSTSAAASATWIAPSAAGNYSVLADLYDSGFTILTNATASFYTGGSAPANLSADAYEPNNDHGNASSINLNSTVGSVNIHNSTDEDWWAFNLSTNDTAYVNITFTDSDGDLDLDVYRGTTYLGSSGSITDDESYTITGATAGTHYARVYGYGGDTNNYSIMISIGGGSSTNSSQNDAGSGGDAGGTASTAYNLSVTSGATYMGYVDQTDYQDWYRITVPTSQGIAASLAFNGQSNGTNDLDFYLLDSLTSTIDSSFYSNPETVTSNGTNVGGGDVFLVVDAWNGFSYYNMTIWLFNIGNGSNTTLSPDGYEINDDVGNATSISLPFAPTASLTIHNSTDYDFFEVNMTSGFTYWMNATFVHSVGDIDIGFVDANLTTMAASTSSSDNESVSWTANATGTFYALALGFLGGTNTYSLTIEGPPPVSGDISAVMYNHTAKTMLLSNLTSGSAYAVEVSLYSWNGSGYVYTSGYWLNFTANGSTYQMPGVLSLYFEAEWCIQGDLYDASGTSLSMLDWDMDCIYFELLEASVTSNTGGTISGQNLTNGAAYSYDWFLYIGSGTTYLQNGSGTFTASGSSWSSSISWNQPNTGSQRCWFVRLFDSTGTYVGYHMDCFTPTWPRVTITNVTTNNASASNTLYTDVENLTVGETYGIQSFIYWYTNNTVWTYSIYTN